MEEHDDPTHPVIALATRRIEEPSARRAPITEAIAALQAKRPTELSPDEIVAMLDAAHDLRNTLRGGHAELLAGIYTDFKVTATYEKATRQPTLEANVDAALATDAETKRPPEGRPSLMFGIAGAGFDQTSATAYRIVEVRDLPS